jgi:predicted transcriptional regulator
MNAEAILTKVAGSACVYQPIPEEQPFIDLLHKQNLIMKVQDGKKHGYHITLQGVRWRERKERKFNLHQGAIQ